MFDSANRSQLNISTQTILKILMILVGLYFLYFVRDIVLLLLIALILTAALDPVVDWLQRHHIPRWLGISLLYIVLAGILIGLFWLIIPPVIEQTRSLSTELPNAYHNFLQATGLNKYIVNGGNFEIQSVVQNIFKNIDQPFSQVFTTISGIFGGITTTLIALIITFYLTVQEQGIKKFFRSVVPAKNQPYIINLTNRIQTRIGHWLRGQLILMLIIGVLVYIGLTILGVKYALLLAIFAGFMEIVPFLGPILSAVPAVIIAFGQSPLIALLTVILFVVVHFSENHLITPKVMQKAVGLNPVIIIFALLVGAKLAGLLGVILAVPVTTAIAEFLSDFFENREAQKETV